MKRERSKGLNGLEQAVAKKDLHGAFAIAVAEWRNGRQPELADVACAIGAGFELHPGLTVPRAGKAGGPSERGQNRRAHRAAFQNAWVELAATRDPLALGALLSALTTSCPTAVETYLGGGEDLPAGARNEFATWRTRIEALAKLDDDPRMTGALVALVQNTPFTSGDPETGEAVYEPAIALLERLRDVRSLPALRKLVERPATKTVNLRNFLARRLPVAIKNIESAKIAPLDADSLARIDTIADAVGVDRKNRVTAKAKSGGSEKDLFEAVVLATIEGADAPGPWEVLADHWLESGNPRGELVTLVLADERAPSNDALEKKIQAILRKDKDWLDPALARLTKSRQYRRAMLDSFELLPSSAATAATWQEVARSSDLGTVRHAGQGAASAATFATFLTTGAMRSLSDLSIRTKGVLDEVSEKEFLARRLAHLTFQRVPKDDWLAAVTRDRFPSLQRLRIIPGDEAVDVDALLDLLARWKRRPPLVEITLGRLTHPEFVFGHERLADVPMLAIATDTKLDGFWEDEQPWDEALAVHRTISKGKARHVLKARLCGDDEEIWSAIEAVAKAGRIDQVTFEPIGDPDEDEAIPKALVRRALRALEQPATTLPKAWRARL